MDTQWLPLVGACIGAVVALTGVALSPQFNARQAHKQWLRDKRAEVFEAYFVALQEAESHVMTIDVKIKLSNQVSLPPADAETVVKKLGDAAARLEMYGSAQTSVLAKSVAATYQACILATMFPEKTARAAEFNKAFTTEAGAVRHDIRAELGIK